MWETLITSESSKKPFEPGVTKQAEYYQVNRLEWARRLFHRGSTLEKAITPLKAWHKAPRIHLIIHLFNTGAHRCLGGSLHEDRGQGRTACWEHWGRCLLINGSFKFHEPESSPGNTGGQIFSKGPSHLAFKFQSEFNDTRNDPFELKMWFPMYTH